jgi:integrase
MRWSEATAVMGQHVHGNTLTVRQSWKRIPGGWELDVPKTARSKRTITLPANVVDILQPLPSRGTLLFRTPQGHPIRHSNFYNRVWKPACLAAGFDPVPGLHALRHSHVAWLIAEGVGLPVIQARLGHENITTTIDTYGHLLPDLQVAAAAAADAVFGALPDGLQATGGRRLALTAAGPDHGADPDHVGPDVQDASDR